VSPGLFGAGTKQAFARSANPARPCAPPRPRGPFPPRCYSAGSSLNLPNVVMASVSARMFRAGSAWRSSWG